MRRTIVLDGEYLTAAESYSDAARKVYEATEFFKKSVAKLFSSKAIVGRTAHNMSLFLAGMTAVLRATLKEQVALASLLCGEYVKKIDEADKSKSFNQSTKGVQYLSFFKAAETPYNEDLVILDNAAVKQCVGQLKEGPLKDIEAYLMLAERITFTESIGAVKEKNETVRDKTVESLRALLSIFNAFITTIESVSLTMQETDAALGKSLGNAPFAQASPSTAPGAPAFTPWVPKFPIK
jgi:chorismate mutase